MLDEENWEQRNTPKTIFPTFQRAATNTYAWVIIFFSMVTEIDILLGKNILPKFPEILFRRS